MEDIKSNITKLVSLYEKEKQRADALALSLADFKERNKKLTEQITDLNLQIDDLNLRAAFMSLGDTEDAKDRLGKLIREIDKCIKLLES